MKLYNHLADIGLSVQGPWERFEDIPSATLLAALRRRIKELETHPDDVADAFGDCGDSYEVTEEDQQRLRKAGMAVENDEPESVDKDQELIRKIADRAAVSVYGFLSVYNELVKVIPEVHASCPLRLQELLKAEPEHFEHDIRGILRCWQGGKFESVFQPRYAVQP